MLANEKVQKLISKAARKAGNTAATAAGFVAKSLFQTTLQGAQMVMEVAPVVAQGVAQGISALQQAREERRLLDQQYQLELQYYQAQLAEQEMIRMQAQGLSSGPLPPASQDRFGDPFSQSAARAATMRGYSDGSEPQLHRMRDRMQQLQMQGLPPPYQHPLKKSEGSMASSSQPLKKSEGSMAPASAAASSSSAAPSQQHRGVLGFIDQSRRNQGLRAVRDPYQGYGKPKGKTLIHVPAPVLEYFDVKNDPYMMKP
jgi:hypothetical protein